MLSITEVLSLANSKDAPWIKKRRMLSTRRILYSVRSDFLVSHTDIWYRNRYPDNDRVTDIMKSIELEGEPDNRIYLALITGIPKLMCFDGNHRREALIRLYHLKNFTCWVDLDILMNVEDTDVVNAFRRINLGVSVPDVYIETNETEHTNGTIVYRCEEFIKEFKIKWNFAIVDKNKTRAPYCTKNNFIELIIPFLEKMEAEKLMNALNIIHEDNLFTLNKMSTKDVSCYIFYYGIKHVKQQLRNQLWNNAAI
jgi:hypothetical protein